MSDDPWFGTAEEGLRWLLRPETCVNEQVDLVARKALDRIEALEQTLELGENVAYITELEDQLGDANRHIQALERQQIPPELWEEIEGWRSQSARGLRMTAQQQAFLLARIASYRPEASLGEKEGGQ